MLCRFNIIRFKAEKTRCTLDTWCLIRNQPKVNCSSLESRQEASAATSTSKQVLKLSIMYETAISTCCLEVTEIASELWMIGYPFNFGKWGVLLVCRLERVNSGSFFLWCRILSSNSACRQAEFTTIDQRSTASPSFLVSAPPKGYCDIFTLTFNPLRCTAVWLIALTD